MSLYYKSNIIATRISSFPGEILVKTGDEVSPDTTILRTNYRIGRVCVLRVAQDLKIKPEDISKYISKKEGDRVKWSETIASRTSFDVGKHIESPVDGTVERIDSKLGVIVVREILERPDVPIVIDLKEKFKKPINTFEKYVQVKEGERVEYGQTLAGSKLNPYVPIYKNKVTSPCAGKITKVDCDNGEIHIQKDIPTTEMKAHYWGSINRIIPQRGAEIEFGGYVMEGAFGTGDTAWGKLARSDKDVNASIVFSERPTCEDIRRVTECHPAGFVIGSLDYEAIEFLDAKRITSVVLEGFGTLHVNNDYKNLIAQSVGRKAVLKASTQVRAGVTRPEVIIPSDKEFYTYRKSKKKYRIIWGKHYGKIGVLKGPPQYDKTSSGTETWLCEMICDDGEEITLPSNNTQTVE